MSNEIGFNKWSIKEVFSQWYCVPNYQRPYVWEKEQIFALLDDISSACKKDKNSEYFLGSLVLQEKKENGTSEYNVLDGQQRLTTLFLMTAVIRNLSGNKQLKEVCQENIYQKSNPFKGIPERLRILFDIRNDVKEFIEFYVKDERVGLWEEIQDFLDKNNQNKSLYNMANAMLFIKEYFYEFDSIDDVLNEFFIFLMNKVVLISVSTKNLNDAFKLFSVLNNRGVKLRSADILKAENLGVIKDLKESDKCAEDWEDIEDYFREEFDEFLSHLQTILTKDKSRMDLFKEFEENIFGKNKLERGKSFFEFVKKHKNNYVYLFDENQDLEIKNLLKVMSAGFNSGLWLAPLLKYYDKFSSKQLLEFVKCLNAKFISNLVSGYTPNDRIVNMNEIIRQIEAADSPSELMVKDCLMIDEKSMIDFISGNIYGWQARYILLLVNYLYSNKKDCEFNIPEQITIEHILPQNPKEDSQWRRDFTDEEREEWTDKLGNLIILSRRKNSSQSNLDFELKKEKYFEGNVELGRSAYIMSKDTWKLDDLKSNHEEVITKLKEYFGISS